MIIDSRLPQGDYAITAATGTNLLTDVLDLAGLKGAGGAELTDASGAAAPNAYQPNWTQSVGSAVTTGSIVANENGALVLRIAVSGGSTGLTAVGAGDIRFQLVSSHQASIPSTSDTIVAVDSGSITTSTTGIAAGTVLMQVAVPSVALRRYVAVRTVVAGNNLNATAALRTVNVAIADDVPSVKRAYADNIA